MSFEIMLVNNAGVQKAAAPKSQAKTKVTEGAFQALMSLALTALFGVGTETQAVAGSETVAVDASGDRAEEIAAAGAGAEMLFAPQGEAVGGTPTGQGSLVVGESRSGEEAKVAGPVKIATAASETGGHTGPMNPLMPTQRTAVPGRNGVLARPGSPASRPAAQGITTETAPEAVHAEMENAGAFAGGVRETTDVAVAPDYRFQSYGGRDTAPAADNPGSSLSPRAAEGEAAAPVGGQPPVVGKADVPMPEGKASPTQVTSSTHSAVVIRTAQSEVGEGESFPGSDEADEDEGGMLRGSLEAEAGAPDFTLTEAALPKAGAVRAASEQLAINEAGAESETRDARSLQDVRAISQTLLEESLKRLPRSVELTLDPPQMGSVTALLSQRGQDVTVKFVAHTNEGQRMLQAASEDLARSLGEKGLVLTGFGVDPGYRDDRGQERREHAGKPSGSRYGRVSHLAAAAVGAQVRQVAGSFNWLA